MSKAQTLADLEAKRDALKQELADRDREIKAAHDRKAKIQNLNEETEAHEKETAEMNEYCEKAHAEIDVFPTDTQLLKLERRQESLKNQVKESERAVAQRETGIKAYRERYTACVKTRSKLHEQAAASISEEKERVAPYDQQEALLIDKAAVEQCMDTLVAIAEERESDLQSLQQQISECLKEEAERSARIKDLQDRSDTELPQLERDRQRNATEITTEWQKEYEHLQSTYDRLVTVNREQQYHLARGTYIKRAPAAKTNHLEEATLSAQQARIATDVNEANQRLKEISDELYYSKKQVSAVKTRGRAAAANFEQEMDAWRQKDEVADSELSEIIEEGRKLRDVKSELSQVLSAIRDT